ncbi:MAG: hydrogenase iron-sulfur subunit [Dehalococcoidales bacterium]
MVVRHEFEPRILGFLCNWCCYAGADLAGVSRYQYPPTMRIIRVMCSGRVDMAFVLRAFKNGTDGVFIGGCWLGDCHYLTQGNYEALSMMHICKKLMEQIGINPDRLRLEWVSASEGIRFAEVITDFTKQLKELGPLVTEGETNGNGLKLKLEAATSLVPYIKLVERKRLKVHFETEKEYAEYFNSDETNSLFQELIGNKLAMRQILLLLGEGPLSTGEIAEVLDLKPSQVSKYLTSTARQGLTRFDESQKRFAIA